MKFTLTVEANNLAELFALFCDMPVRTPDDISVNMVSDSPTPVVTESPAVMEPPEPVNTNAPAVDCHGLPWDVRIHAASKAIVADGSWRKRRGVDDAVVAAVEAELRGKAVPVNVVPLPGTPAPVAVPTTEAGQSSPISDSLNRPIVTYEQVVAKMTDALKAGKLNPATLPIFWAEIGVAGVQDLPANAAALAKADAKLSVL